jgi:hypothetical protein
LAEYYAKSEYKKYFSQGDLLPISEAPIIHYQTVLDSIDSNRNEFGNFPNRPKFRRPYYSVHHLDYMGILDTLGNVVVSPQKYVWIGTDYPYPMVSNKWGKYGILGPDWKALQEPTFSRLAPMEQEGVFVGCLDEKCGIFSVNAELLVPFEYDWKPQLSFVFESRCPKYCVPAKNDRGWGFISTQGESQEWGYEEIDEHAFGYWVRRNTDWAWCDCFGKRLSDFAYANLEPNPIEGSYLELVLAGGDPDDYYGREYHLVNQNGKVMAPGRFSNLYPIGKGKIAGVQDGKLMILDTLNWQTTVSTFPVLIDLGELLGTYDSTGYWAIDRNGNIVLPGPFESLEKYHHSLILSQIGKDSLQLWRPNGELFLPGIYDQFEWDEAGWIWARQGETVVLVDTLGRLVPGLKTGSMHSKIHLGTVIVSKSVPKETAGGSNWHYLYGVMDLKGNWVVPCKYPKRTYPNTYSRDETTYSVSDSLESWIQQPDGSWKRFPK